MMSLWITFLLVSVSYGDLSVQPPDGSPPDLVQVIEADFCAGAFPYVQKNVNIVGFNNVPLSQCGNLGSLIPSTVQGAIVYTPSLIAPAGTIQGCPPTALATALANAGAIGYLSSDGITGFRNTGIANTVLSLFCYGLSGPLVSNYTTDLNTWLIVNKTGVIKANITNVPTDPAQLTVLKEMQSQSFQQGVWPLNIDPCAGTAPVPPSRVPWKGITCDANGNIVGLALPFPINGHFPSDFCQLRFLQSLTIQDDLTFLGPLLVCNWTQMVKLVVSGTSMSSTDHSVYNLPNLQTLDLSNNFLSGPLDPTNWTSTKLVTLKLNGNMFSGPLSASFSRFPSLNIVWLNNNNFSGTLPDFTLFAAKQLDLTSNSFNNFTLPPGRNNSMGVLKLGFNQFTRFPQQLVNALTNLGQLNINNNRLTTLPSFAAVKGLAYLDCSYNSISGTLTFLPAQASFAAITLLASHNNFNNIASLPAPTLSSVSQAVAIMDLSYNNFTGVLNIPSFASLRSFDISHNYLTQMNFGSITNLVTADFSNNQITTSLGSLSLPISLYQVDFTNNQLTGVIPNTFFTSLAVASFSGNPGLSHGSSSLLPASVVFSFAISQPFPQWGLECPTYSVSDVRSSVVTLDPNYHNRLLCRCLQNFYRPFNVTDRCVPCLDNALCPGQEDVSNISNNVNILAKQGYFPLPDSNSPTLMVPCRFGVVLPDDPTNPCNPNALTLLAAAEASNRNIVVAATKFGCQTGYSDRLCSRCSAGYFRKSGRCLVCNSRAEYPLFLIAIVIIFLCACAFFTLRTPVDTSTTSINPDGWSFEPKQRIYDFVPLILHFFQVSTIILVKLQSLDVVQTLNSFFVTVSFSTPTSGIGFECGLPVFQGFVTQYLAVVVFPPVLGLTLLGFFAVRIGNRLLQKQEQHWKMSFYQFIYGLFSMYEAIHFPLVTYVLGVFQCTSDPISGISYFSDHPYLLCSSISPAGKVFPLLLYPIGLVGFFVCLGIYLHYAPNDVKESEAVLQSFAFFYIRFKPDRVYSGVVFIFLNLGISFIVGLMEPNTDIFPTLIVLLIIADFFFVSVFQPYLQPRYNKVRSVNDIVALLLFVNNLIYSSDGQFPGRSASPAVIYVGLNIGMVLFYLYHLYRILKLQRGDRLPHMVASGQMDTPHRNEGRKATEMTELNGKRKQTSNMEVSSASHTDLLQSETSSSSHGYVPVTTSPTTADGIPEISSHSSLPIISENESHEFLGNSPRAEKNDLVFTGNPLAETSSSFSSTTGGDGGSPSSKD